MHVLALNCGSSSLKYRLYGFPGGTEAAGGEAVRIGPPTAEPARIIHRCDGNEEIHEIEMPDHSTAFDRVDELLAESDLVPEAIGHRMVHGGQEFESHAVVDQKIMPRLRDIQDLAPLHNPPAMNLLDACRRRYPEVPQAVIFDTVFHATIPPHAHTYALPQDLTRELGLRKYGFHGISHQYVTARAAELLEIPVDQFNGVSCHLGSGGASLCAVRHGRSVDNTMGFSPLQGLLMSTRSGDLDPAAVLRLIDHFGTDPDAVEDLLNRQCGVLGLSGLSSDIRDVLGKLDEGHTGDSQLDDAAQAYLWRIRKYLGAYLTAAGEAHAIIFTDTVGEKVPDVRRAVCADMDAFGVRLDPHRNNSPAHLPADVAADNSPVRILVIPTNEELAIATETKRLTATLPQ